MNDSRRKRLVALVERIGDLVSDLEEIADEERGAMDNMPESLWGSDRYAEMESACGSMDDAVTAMNEAASSLEEVI